jgi:RNA polymerase sigma-70 factor (TIGR02960 family)
MLVTTPAPTETDRPLRNPQGCGFVTETALGRARAGDETAFRELVDPYRAELQLHCYRILGSLQDAEDAVQETLLAAWRGLRGFEGRASLRAWLYRIATNRCLNVLRDRGRRPREVPAMPDPPEPTRTIEPTWLEPYPDVLLEGLADAAPGPHARYEAKESIELAFMVALHALPPRQRAVLVLSDVLGFARAEVAEMLDTGEASVKGALQRARAALRTQPPAADRELARPDSADERRLVGRFAEATENGDIDAMVALLTDTARLTMPPLPLEYQGHAPITAFLRYRAELRGVQLRLVATRANTQPAFAAYRPDAGAEVARPWGLFVLTLEGGAIAAITWFTDTDLFRHFGLPSALPSH